MTTLARVLIFEFVATCVGLLIVQTPAAEPHSWKVYTNVRFTYSICYPQDLLVPQGETDNSDGQKFLAKDGAVLIVFGQNNALDQTLKEVMKDTGSRLAGPQGTVTYQAVKQNWFVVSGQKDKSVFYSKTLYARNQYKSFELTYSREKSDLYKRIITRLSDCFVNTGRR